MTTEGLCLPWVVVSENEGGCKEEVEILRNLWHHWRWAYRQEDTLLVINFRNTQLQLKTGPPLRRSKHAMIFDRRIFHTRFFFSPLQDPWYILPDKGVGFHHQADLRSDK